MLSWVLACCSLSCIVVTPILIEGQLEATCDFSHLHFSTIWLFMLNLLIWKSYWREVLVRCTNNWAVYRGFLLDEAFLSACCSDHLIVEVSCGYRFELAIVELFDDRYLRRARREFLLALSNLDLSLETLCFQRWLVNQLLLILFKRLIRLWIYSRIWQVDDHSFHLEGLLHVLGLAHLVGQLGASLCCKQWLSALDRQIRISTRLHKNVIVCRSVAFLLFRNLVL